MLMTMDSHELRKALAEIEAAEKHGFNFCLAVMEFGRVNETGHLSLRYSDLWEKAHPTSGHLDWGRFQRVSAEHRFEGGALVPIESSAASKKRRRRKKPR